MKVLVSIILLLLLFTSCRSTRSLKEGELLYKKHKFNVEFKSDVKRKVEIKDEISKVVGPAPNRKFLGLKIRLWVYANVTPKEGKKGLRYWLHNSVGEAPVLFKEDYPERIEENIKRRANELGFFNPVVTSTVVKKKKKVIVYYNLELHQPYMVRNVGLLMEDNIVKDSLESFSFEELKNRRFQTDLLSTSQKDMEYHLRDRGFYLFNRRAISFDADTTVGDHEVDLFVRLNIAKLPEKGDEIFYIQKAKAFVDFEKDSSKVIDTLNCYGNSFYRSNYKYNPAIILDPIYMHNGEYYSRLKQKTTLQNYGYLGVFGSVRTTVNITDSTNNQLELQYDMRSSLPKQLETKLTFSSKSNGFIGPLLENSITNKNIFKGAEKLIFSFDVGFEKQLNDYSIDYIFSFSTGVEIQVPRIMAPIRVSTNPEAGVPITSFRFEYKFYNYRPYFRTYSIGPIMQYLWYDKKDRYFEFAPIDISYRKNTPEDESLTPEEIDVFSRSFANLENQFTLGSNFYLTLKSKTKENYRYWVYRSGVDLSGILVNTLATAAGNDQQYNKEIFGVPFSQYVRLESEPSYSFKFSPWSEVATRVVTNVGIPFGNSTEVPYFKQYSLGGPYSIRAFLPRTIGPGTFTTENKDSDFLLHSGEIYLEYNLEFRQNLTRIFELGLFFDVGNIWLVNENPLKPGGEFTNEFYKQLAVGSGLGARLDFDFLVIRLDWGIPLRRPTGWVVQEWDFLSSSWRRKNLIWNFAIGYPF